MQTLKGLSQRVLLIVLDGFGISDSSPKNAIKDAHTPNIDRLFQNYPFTTIISGGEEVGLPSGISGNSEVGHLNLGAGRSIRQDLVRINECVENHSMKDLEKFKELIQKAKTSSKRIHLLGLLSDGGVHSHINHIKEVISLLGEEKDLQIFFHAFMDGRDTPIQNGVLYIEELQKLKNFQFASMQGRSIGMDRDRRWQKTEQAYQTLIGQGRITNLDPISYIKDQYSKKIFDEFIEPVLFDGDMAIRENDSVFFLNFRPDRARQLTMAFTDKEFPFFPRPLKPNYYLCMTPYLDDNDHLNILFTKEKIRGGLSEYLAGKGLKQFKIAETEKYAHVTYFFNGGEEQPFPGEERALVPSPREVKTYDEKPEMSAFEVLEKLQKAISDKSFSFYLVNFANADMVGHTGNYQAAIKAIETLDQCIGKLMEKCESENMAFIVTADHGNCDQMSYEDGSPHTSHTNSLVPFSLFHPQLKGKLLKPAGPKFALKDVAPTILHLMGQPMPKEFTGTPIFS